MAGRINSAVRRIPSTSGKRKREQWRRCGKAIFAEVTVEIAEMVFLEKWHSDDTPSWAAFAL